MKLKTLVLGSAMLMSHLVSPGVVAEQIVLNDGSSINGRVLSMNNGQYQVQTSSLGVINLPQSKVRSISNGSAAPSLSQSTDSSAASALAAMQANMTSDPGVMSSILGLQNDPDMQAVLRDPEIMRAVQSFDLQALTNNPKIKKLMNNSEIRKISGKVN